MNRFLLLALTAGLLSPIAAKAETYWLILKPADYAQASGLLKIEMKSLAKCEEQGYIWADKKNKLIENPQAEGWTARGSWKCLVGK